MIVRYGLTCETCEHPHTARISLGNDSIQTHKFPCAGCGEEIVLRVDLDQQNVTFGINCVENAVAVTEPVGGSIITLNPNFLIPADEQGKDGVFPHLGQLLAMAKEAERAGMLRSASAIPDGARGTRPFRQPDYAHEWRLLRKAWSLGRNGRQKLSEKRVAAASAELYGDDPLDNLADWVWRLAMFLCNPGYEVRFREAMELIRPLYRTEPMDEFARFYADVAVEHGSRYFDLMKEFFAGYGEFSQVYFFVVKGMAIPAGQHTTSTDFEAVRMFYGNAYEQFTSLVEILALLNNMLLGRKYDTFAKLTLHKYRELDRPGRFGPFKENATFMAICEERDNEVRNASHHGSFVFEQGPQIIRYRSGPGGSGPEQTMSYVDYLGGCVRIFLQTMTLFRAELILSNQLGVCPPI